MGYQKDLCYPSNTLTTEQLTNTIIDIVFRITVETSLVVRNFCLSSDDNIREGAHVKIAFTREKCPKFELYSNTLFNNVNTAVLQKILMSSIIMSMSLL
jgi:hypothetical protein